MTLPDISIAIPRDDLDDLYNYNVDNADDVFRDFNANLDAPVHNEQSETTRARNTGTDLGIDNEVQIVKQRKPVAKLDENKLLSRAGIPKLRRITKERLKFKGKGHEYSDIARLLNLYQLWLDDLYPRAKFADGLALIEKLGHTKRVQTMRREWIKGGNPINERDKQSATNNADTGNGREDNISESSRPDPAADHQKTERTSMIDDADLYEATPEAENHVQDGYNGDVLQRESLFLSDDENGVHSSKDDLDTLLDEDVQEEASQSLIHVKPAVQTSLIRTAEPVDLYEDEMEAMAGMDDMW